MSVLPVVERELRVASRRRGTYWTRFTSAAVALVVFCSIWVFVRGAPSSVLSSVLFDGLSWLAMVYCLFVGMSLTADCLSEEKREGTLGLMFLTDLRGYDVVLGKLAATSLNAFYRLLAIFPILAIPLLLGGLSAGEFWRRVLVLMNTLFFSLCVGMFVSAMSREHRRAIGGSVTLLLLIALGPPVLGAIRLHNEWIQELSWPYLVSSPLTALITARDSYYNPAQGYAKHFWYSIILTHGLGWSFLILASLIVPHAWQDRPGGAGLSGWRGRWQGWRMGDPAERALFRRRLLEVNPYYWVVARQRLKPLMVLGLLGMLGLSWLWLAAVYRDLMLDMGVYILTGFILHLIIKCWVAAEATRPLFDEKKEGTLEMLLSTPLSVESLLNGQLLALLRQFGWPVLIILGADGVMFVAGLNQVYGPDRDWLMAWFLGVMIFLADIYVLAWVGMWLGLTSKKQNTATTGAILRILVLPWLLFVGFLMALAVLNPRSFDPSPNFMWALWFTIAILNNAFFFVWARTNLLLHFRRLATERYQAGGGTERGAATL